MLIAHNKQVFNFMYTMQNSKIKQTQRSCNLELSDMYVHVGQRREATLSRLPPIHYQTGF